ncbi:hypothetical protein DSL64_01770 [Dyadobacter luteus]|uniref:VOC family protein n=1 Tax=Dyadobacter luteus TaxID=2259619 RepID=A0A3D8YJL2_9BACT|nr:hypothetical protein [Dyadobacter luteus]REA64301.1 hypothetical protein DSL64_01770 [Dyadobacter luteus]
MYISAILTPVVTDSFETTVAFYQKITGKEVTLSASHDGYKLNLIGHFVVLAALDDPRALDIPRMVNAIFLVEDLEYFWELIQNDIVKVIVPYSQVSTGKRFIVEQNDGKVIEYLQLNKS